MLSLGLKLTVPTGDATLPSGGSAPGYVTLGGAHLILQGARLKL